MRNIILIFKNSVLRNKLMLILAAAAALIMINVFTSMSESGTMFDYGAEQINIGMIDHDSSPLSDGLKSYFTDTLGMSITEENDYDLLANLLIDTKISAIIEIPQGMYKNAANGNVGKLTITTLDDYENAAFAEVYLNSYMQSVKILSDAADGNTSAFEEMLSSDIKLGSVTVANTGRELLQKEKSQEAYIFAVGFMLMIISGITLFISNTIITDRQIGTYSRMQCSSIKPGEYIIGVGIFGIICCSAMNLIFTLFVFSKGNDIAISCGLALLINELFVLFSVGVAIVFALCCGSQTTLFTAAIGYTTLGSMLGGAWFPINEDLGVVSNIAKLFPQYWFMDMLRSLNDDPAYNYFPNICILVLSVVLAYLISAVIFTQKSS